VTRFSKLADCPSSRQTLIGFGVLALLGTFLPLEQLAVAGTLIPTAPTWWGAMEVLPLLLVVVVGIGINVDCSRKPNDHRFGQLHSASAGWSLLVPSSAIAAATGFVLWSSGKSATVPA